MYVFLSFSLGLIYVIALERRFRRGGVRELALRLSPRDICLFARMGKKGYSDYRYDHVAFLGFRYYHSIEYTKLDWLKASCYRSFKIQTLSLPKIHFLVCKKTSVVSSHSELNETPTQTFLSQIQLSSVRNFICVGKTEGKTTPCELQSSFCFFNQLSLIISLIFEAGFLYVFLQRCKNISPSAHTGSNCVSINRSDAFNSFHSILRASKPKIVAAVNMCFDMCLLDKRYSVRTMLLLCFNCFI